MADDRGDRPGGQPDAYQARYMGGAGGPLHHDKMRAPLAYHVVFALPLFAVVATALVGRTPLVVPLLTGLVLLASWLLFSVLRITVSRGEVHIQYGLFGPRIPIGSIERCEAITYDAGPYGGWGIRYGNDGSVAYNMLGDQGHAVRITYREGARTRVVVVASRDPARLAAAIEEARAAALPASAPAPVRVEAEAAPEAPPVDAETHAEMAEQQRKA